MESYLSSRLTFVMGDYAWSVRVGQKQLLWSTRGSVPWHMDQVRMDLSCGQGFNTSVNHSQNNFVRDPNGIISAAAIGEVLEAMRKRSSTREEDQAIIIGTILGLDVKLLASSRGQERMRAFYDVLERIPAEWIFLGLPTLDLPNYRWAPKTLILKNQPTLVPVDFFGSGKYSTVTEKGLLGTYPVITLQKPHAPLTGFSATGVPVVKPGSNVKSYCVIGSLGGTLNTYEPTTWFKDTEHDMFILEKPLEDEGERKESFVLLAQRRCGKGISENRSDRITCTVIAQVRAYFWTKDFMESLGEEVYNQTMYKDNLGHYIHDAKLRLV